MKMIDLSICIPTFNRAIFLEEAIESIIDQLDRDICKRVEIVVSDNCSTDNTVEVLNSIIQRNPNITIKYSVNDKNEGPDNNYLRVVSLATGKYCWFLGSDDKIQDGAIKRVLDQLNKEHTIYISDRFNAGYENMEITGIQRFFTEELTSDTVFAFNRPEDWDFYLNRCSRVGALFSYLSSIVFLKESWDSIEDSLYGHFIGTAYVHVAVLLYMLKNKNSTIMYLKNPIVINRTGNDSFFKNAYQRTMLDINGYLMLSDIFDDNIYAQNGIRRLLKREHPSINWRLIIKTTNKQFEDLVSKLELLGYSKLEIDYFRTLRMFKPISFFMIILYKLLNRS